MKTDIKLLLFQNFTSQNEMMTFEEEEKTTFRRLHNNSVHSKATKSIHVWILLRDNTFLRNENKIKIQLDVKNQRYPTYSTFDDKRPRLSCR